MGPSHRYETPALVVRVRPFGETSQVVHLATPEGGLVAALGKGAHRPGSDLQGGLSLGTAGHAHLLRRPGAELELLRRFRLTADLRALGRDLDRYRCACHVLELLRTWMRPALPNAPLFHAALTALRALALAPVSSLGAWTAWFEARALASSGHRPRLEGCAVCDRTLAEGASATFSAPAGGFVHPDCAPPGPSTRLGAQARLGLLHLYTARLPQLRDAPPGAAIVRAARAVHDIFVPWVMERRPPTLNTLPGRGVTRP